ncbi:type IV toxin-antitoxin system AbiEi family antitoxin [Pseudopelagicola sp. nBUS_19]|uniref:type IV toxin-antitoxin system AbiEi family antitoxin n=1 Tax=Pseudopelagicola sp. nBUS_19 TaxID=3395316 RepID=UPI003EBF3C5B
MRLKEAISQLIEQDKKGNYVFHSQDLRAIFFGETDRNFTRIIRDLVNEGFLVRASKGVFYNPSSRHFDGYTLERIAGTIRRGELCYLSQESVLSAHSIISQQMMGTITVMTTGKSGRYPIENLGVIEFTRTKKKVEDVMPKLLHDTNFLPHANAELAYTELKRAGRNMHLVDKEILEEVIHEQRDAKLPKYGR